MQAMYAACAPMAGARGENALLRFLKQKDYLMRPEKRSPYDDASGLRPSRPGGGGRRPGAGVLYMLATLLLLVVLYPVGLFFLWAGRLRWRVSTKLLVTVITAAVFCVLVVFAINYDTGNPRVKGIQDGVRGALEKVNEYTGDGVDGALSWFEKQYDTGAQTVKNLWEAVKPHAARETVRLYGYVEKDIYAAKVRFPSLLLGEYKRLIDYKPPVKPVTEPVKQATPDAGVNVTVKPTLAPTQTPAPTSTPVPTQTPVPVVLPAIKQAGLAPVFFTANGVYYHATANCSGMMNAVSHTLAEARDAGKQVCENCAVTPYSMADSEYYFWVDDAKCAHTTDECAEFFKGRYTLLPFEDVYAGSYTYCAACGGDTCLAYIRQHEGDFTVAYENLNEDDRALYDYEKTLTVYYGENSRNYHANTQCQYMEDAKYVHTLYQALHVDKKQMCTLCKPLNEEGALAQMNAAQATAAP